MSHELIQIDVKDDSGTKTLGQEYNTVQKTRDGYCMFCVNDALTPTDQPLSQREPIIAISHYRACVTLIIL